MRSSIVRSQLLCCITKLINPDALDVQHDEIADWAEESLNHCQKRLNEELENVVEEFGALMQVMAGVEDHVDEPFGNERLVTSRQDENGVRQEVGFPIADRMQALHDIIEREENQLDGGWQQWSVVQAEMICLAIEVLGSDNVHLENSILLDSLVKQIEMAGNQHEKDNMRYVEVEQAIFGLETELTRMCNDRSKMMKAQQKASVDHNISPTLQLTFFSQQTLRAERKKMLDNIKKAMADFEKIR